ncbi:MAG TPA: YihY/virulence factor BrkB family protein [Candidatus Limnocylindrales bacterium]|nr:YihY/virulence factor BrkB family protein [Candidatus Limnocylindrales bacterium]
MAALQGVLARYDAAGGGLLAGGLAYSALFAIVPLTVLVAGIVGLLVSDEVRQAEVVSAIASVLPPIRDIVELVLEEAAGAAGALSILGGLALIWGASRFIVTFEDAIRRIFGGTERRGFVVMNVAAFGAVIGLIGAFVVGTVLAGLASFLDAAEARGGVVVDLLGEAALIVVPPVVAAGSLALVYRFVPIVAPGWRAILPPAVVVAIVLDVLARVFVFLAPRLIGAAATIGALATAFAALAWLGLSFQAILLGAAWVRQRDARWGRTSVEVEPEVLPEG